MVLRNGRPNDILSVSRDVRANSTSQSTALFPTVILAGCATLAIYIEKSRCPFDAMRCASCHIACSTRMHACMHAYSFACAYDFHPQHSRERKTGRGDESDAKSILDHGAVSGRLTRREVTWQFFCRSYYSWLIWSPRLHLSLADQIKRV